MRYIIELKKLDLLKLMKISHKLYTTFKKAEKGWHTNKLHWNEAIWPSRGHGFIYNYVERTKSVKKVGDKSLDIFTFLIY